MDNDDEGAKQAPSIFPRLVILLIALIACNKIEKGAAIPYSYTPPPDTVKIAAAPAPKKKKKKKIYLTFDDGPNKGTRKVLNIVQQEQVAVTFFVIGEHVFASTSQKATWDSLKVAQSIELCNHSYTHALHNKFSEFYKTPDTVVKDFERCRDSLGLDNNIGRTPGRNIWRVDTLSYTDLKKSAVAADSLQQAGFTIVGWDLEWHYDHKSFTLKNTSDDLLRQIDSLFAWNKTKTPEHLVLLAHDQVYDDANDSSELHQFIKKLKGREEYELVLTSKYPGVKKPQ